MNRTRSRTWTTGRSPVALRLGLAGLLALLLVALAWAPSTAAAALTERTVNRAGQIPIGPVAINDSFSATEDTPLVVAGPGVLGNDTEPNSMLLSAVLATNPAHGTLALNADGSFSYTPSANYHGADSFTYQASNGTVASAPATVTLTVASVNDAPGATADSFSATGDTPLTVAAPGVLANDADSDADPLTAVLATGPAHGTLALNADGSFTYTPNAGFLGQDSFTYQANDGAFLSVVATVTLTVTGGNDAPVALPDAYATIQGLPLVVAAPGPLANDTDGDADPLAAFLVTGPAHGTLTLNPDGAFTYTPENGFSGADSFTYAATDGVAQSVPATVTLQVGATATLTLAASGPGAVAADPAAPAQPVGTVVTLTAAAQGGADFVGWTVDGQPAGWAPTLTITLDRDHAVVARFVAPTAFGDVAPGDPAADAIRALVARGIIFGYGDGTFGPADTVNRAQAAALVARALGWSGESHANPFTDQGPVDGELWDSVAILAHHGVARGYGDGTYDPLGTVSHAQATSLITRAMVAKGYWVQQPDDAGRFASVGDSGHRQDLLTYQHYVGGFPELTEGSDAAAWFGPATRGWSARALWAALDQYQRVDRTP